MTAPPEPSPSSISSSTLHWLSFNGKRQRSSLTGNGDHVTVILPMLAVGGDHATSNRIDWPTLVDEWKNSIVDSVQPLDIELASVRVAKSNNNNNRAIMLTDSDAVRLFRQQPEDDHRQRREEDARHVGSVRMYVEKMIFQRMVMAKLRTVKSLARSVGAMRCARTSITSRLQFNMNRQRRCSCRNLPRRAGGRVSRRRASRRRTTCSSAVCRTECH